MAYLNTISFPLASDRIAHYSTGDNAVFASIFDTTNNLMVVQVLPGEYTPRIRTLGRTGVIEGLDSSQPRNPTTRQEATVNLQHGSIVVAAVLNELRQNAIDDDSYTIEVWDGCLVDFDDRAQGYSVRQWWLETPVVPLSAQANLGTGGEQIYAGYTLDFINFAD